MITIRERRDYAYEDAGTQLSYHDRVLPPAYLHTDDIGDLKERHRLDFRSLLEVSKLESIFRTPRRLLIEVWEY